MVYSLPMELNNPSSTWRQALGECWVERRALTDWMGIPEMHDHVARLHTGTDRQHGGDWIDHSLKRYLQPLAERLGRALSLVSFGCGDGGIERAFLERGWPIGRIVCREYDEALLGRAAENINNLCEDSQFQRFDYNDPDLNDPEVFDLAFFCHSMHHCTNIEQFLPYLNRCLASDGIILGLDYFGPSRLQTDFRVHSLLDEIFKSFPKHLRLHLGTGEVEEEFRIDTASDIARGDPSEAPRSADLRSLVFSSFPVIELSPMGGTLLRPLLAHRAGNFRSEEDKCILMLIMMLERELIRSNALSSDNLYFVLERSRRL
jgi:SAM-dependent methyltransferase